jgi:hypothetical protein
VNVRWDEKKKKAIYVIDEKEYLDVTGPPKVIAAAKKTGEAKVTRAPIRHFGWSFVATATPAHSASLAR